METIKFSITSHRGCYGECNFCSIGLHEGKTVISRSERSIIAEAQKLGQLSDFKGYILDVGGSTANMYGIECFKKQEKGACKNKRCLYPRVCANIKADHGRQINLLKELRKIKGIKKVFVASGIRYDLLLCDKKHGLDYLQELVRHHISGQLKVAPEHISPNILSLMGKPKAQSLLNFKHIFEDISSGHEPQIRRQAIKTSTTRHHSNNRFSNISLRKPQLQHITPEQKQFLTYYFIAAHPGCTEENMRELKSFASRELKTHPRQVQIFTPLPSTYSALMYVTQTDPFTGRKIFVEKNTERKQRQKDIVLKNNS